ncbi:autotransporter domain-containing protein [Bradyrhizobium jicamae]|uniref:Autotransporter domain-containing protein n=1 Tax=Bradyrhizobium jicamae TaxID=280332 RepID=A0ABS5FV39_9BRAD|nr:autotransporter domain-containing protein [Bradyrhizobium jicamae]MBR0800706.1 autotransporter domain-containing protein [Bradyrhizobium jicamae]
MAFKNLRIGAPGILIGSIFATLVATPSRADEITDRIVQNVVQNILQNVRDQIQSRQLAGASSPGRLQFTGDSEGLLPAVDNPFAALGYAKAPVYTKAPPAPPPPTYIYGLNLIGSGDSSRAAGITVSSFGGTGAADITKIGIFSAYDALTFVFTGSGVWSNAPGIDTNTGVGAGTIAYINGGFSADFTVTGSWSSSSSATAGVTDGTGLSYAPNVQYKFEIGNGWYIEPTIGVTYSEAYTANFDTQIGNSTEVHGGARFGTETTWNGVRVQPSLKLEAFSLVSQSGVGAVVPSGTPITIPSVGLIATGQVGGRASGKLNILWTPTFSSFVEAHGTDISGFSSYGALGGFRWTF